VVGLTVDNGSHPIIFNESLVRIQFQNQLYQVGNLDQPSRVTYNVQYLQSRGEKKSQPHCVEGCSHVSVNDCGLFLEIMLQLSSRVSGVCLLRSGRASLVQRRLQPISVNDYNLFLGIRRLQLSSGVSGLCFLGQGRASLVQQMLQPISFNDCNLFFQELEGCSLVPGSQARVSWDEEEVAGSSQGCCLFLLMIVICS
jgi:hypothetical protein